jgi:rhodanese-related sulfurtransferase
MKKLFSYFLVIMLLPALVLTGCKDDDDSEPQLGDYKTLSTYMVNSGYDLPALLEGWVIDPKPITDDGIVDVENECTIPGWTVFDIRTADDFNSGHIKGSFNVTLKDIVTEAKAINGIDKILVVCYSGQTAGRAVMALRLSGFANAKVMKFGFSAWSNHSAFDKWSSKTANIAVGSPNWVTTASPSLPVNGLPTWTTTATEGADILSEKITEMLAGEGWGVKSDLVLETPADYSIYNFWTTTDYTGYGHYTGAYQYKPISLVDDIVKAMNPENNNLIYCYTGQTSSYIVAWLNVLGYDAKSIYNGVNSLSYDALVTGESPHWHFPYHEYTYEVFEVTE